MSEGDFFSHEKSVTLPEACEARIELVAEDGTVKVLKEKLPLLEGEVMDATFMNCKMLREFFEREIEDAKQRDVLFSLHLKATMMKISDPIMFGHCVKAYYKDVFAKSADTFAKLGVNANSGLGDVYKKIEGSKEDQLKAFAKEKKIMFETEMDKICHEQNFAFKIAKADVEK